MRIKSLTTNKQPRNTASTKSTKSILWFKEISIDDVHLVGGKNASLGEMYNNLTKKGISVPNGFAITAASYRNFLDSTGLRAAIKKAMWNLDVNDIKKLHDVGAKVRGMILKTPLPKALEQEITSAYDTLGKEEKTTRLSVAVRSSATAEDLPGASFAGQQETYLNIRGRRELLIAVRKCIASLFTDRAISYREAKGFDHLSIALSVTVQTMVGSATGASGVLFTMDTESGFPGVVLINASYGLGEYVVKGKVTPDQFYVFKEGVRNGKSAIISKILGTKEVKLIVNENGGTKHIIVPMSQRDHFSITPEDVVQLTKWGMLIEEYYKTPQDIEWAKDGATGKLYVVQARPETVKSISDNSFIESYTLKQTGKLLLSGIAVGQKIGAGKVHIINNPANLRQFKTGEVLVTRITDPDWEPIMRMASAIITEQGSKTSHAAIVSRELGVPCIVGAANARKILHSNMDVTVSCAEGDKGHIYKGVLPFEVKRTELKKDFHTKTKIMMNVGNPENAFPLSFLPNDGVGLARLEFIFTNFVRIHPLALVNYSKIKNKSVRKHIGSLTRGYQDKASYGVDKLAEGIGRIATAFYPNNVVVRLSDFKTNEYSTLIGGAEFEPKEENPMIGWRGASRYYSKIYKPAFKLECEAIKKAREEWGLKNIIVMVPFCRTPEEGKKVLETMAEFGLKRGENGLKIYVMCEIPSNVILAADFAKLFDGFSIGSNDLAQLTLGIDRDSNRFSDIGDATHPAVKALIRTVIKAAQTARIPIGICGQAPSDHPEFADWLVKEGIDSISLNPDTVVATRERIAHAEKTIGTTAPGETNRRLLGIVAAFGVLAAGIMSLGAGCGFSNTPTIQPTMTPAQIRAEIQTMMAEARNLEEQNAKSTAKVSGFANFSVAYPRAWSAEYAPDHLTIKSASVTTDTVTFFIHRKNYLVKPEDIAHLTMGGQPALMFIDPSTVSTTPVTVYEIELANKKILEINSTLSASSSAVQTDIINSLNFSH